jgi:hypothetical protein
MKKIGFFLLVAAAVIAVFVARQLALNKVKDNNESLRQRINAQTSESATDLPMALQSTKPIVALKPHERSELLRLRGQIQLLHRELQEMSNRVVILAQPSVQRAPAQTNQLLPSEQSDRKAEIQVMNTFTRTEPYKNARILSIALRDYLKAHSGELPDDLAKVDSPLQQSVSERFELMRSGRIPEEARPYTLVAREKQPHQMEDGRWFRIYLRADGASVTATLRSASRSDWKAWEQSDEAFMKKHPIGK